MNVDRLSVKDEKSMIRRVFKDRRAAFVLEQGAAAEAALHKNLKKWLRDEGSTVEQYCAYRAITNEINPCSKPLTEYFFPRIETDGLSFWRPLTAEAFTPNKYGILEPSPDAATPLDLTRPAVVFTPALAVDSLGRRIGSGLGFYDRFFDRAPHVIRVGVTYHVQVSHDPLPAEGFDQLLDWIVTDQMILRVSRRSS